MRCGNIVYEINNKNQILEIIDQIYNPKKYILKQEVKIEEIYFYKILKNKKILNKSKRYRELSRKLIENFEKINKKEFIRYLEIEKEREGISNRIYFEEGFKEGLKFIKYFLQEV